MNWLALFFHLVKVEESILEESSVFFNNFWKPLRSNVSIWKEDWPDFPQSSQNSLTISTPSSSKSSPLYLSASETFAKQVRAVKYFAWRLSRSLMQSRISKVSFLAQSSSFCTCLPCRSPPWYLATSPSVFYCRFQLFLSWPTLTFFQALILLTFFWLLLAFYWLSSDFYWLSNDFYWLSRGFYYQEGGQDSNHIVVGFQTSGWKSN